MGEREIPILRLEEVRTGVLRDDPGTAVLTVKGGGEVRRYYLSAADLVRLAQQMTTDAKLIAG